jgi:CRISPR-associated protein Csd1
MGFWQNLVDSYDKNAEALRAVYPLSTTSISNNGDMIVVIGIDADGNLVKVDKIDKAKKDKRGYDAVPVVQICIPVTEKSMGRSSGIAPHPVFDQYEYLVGSGAKFEEYISILKNFADSQLATVQVKAIYKYVSKRTIENDLKTIVPKSKTNIVFEVEIPGSPRTKVWEDISFYAAWHKYYLSEKKTLAERRCISEKMLAENKKLTSEERKRLKEEAKISDTVSLDYIAGIVSPVAESHPKKISNASANSKLISDNDKSNFTFRGKFSDSAEAFAIGYESSQKAHQFLRYLIGGRNRALYCGEQVIVSFTIGSLEEVLPPPVEDKNIWAFLQESIIRTESDTQIALSAETGIDYADALRKSISGYGYSETLQKHTRTAVIALDAATTGRLSITFYRELGATEYLESIADWHNECKWNQQFRSSETQELIPYAGAPSIDKIIEAVYGKARGGKDESYTKIKKAARERLLRCVFDKAFLPKDYVTSATRRASNPLGVTTNGKFDRYSFGQLLSTTCALIRKESHQLKKEVFTLSIELDRTDRDYLYGRLLGAADKLEEYALYKKEKDRVVTSAIRHMQAFAQRPYRTWQTIHSCLNPYIQKVKGGFSFKEIEAIKNKFDSVEEYKNDLPLDGSYLIGYYHERAYIDSLVKEVGNKSKASEPNKKENENV